jgi:hypothetical protein
MVKNADDGFQIVEQILPHFVPEYTVNIIAIPELDLRDDVPIVLKDISKEDTFTGEFTERRVLIWTLNFTAYMNFYGPIIHQGVIKKAQVDILIPPGQGPVTKQEVHDTPRSARITTLPDPIDALPEDDYGFTTDVEEFNDGKKYDPTTDTDVEVE